MRKELIAGFNGLKRLHWGVWLVLFLMSTRVSVFALRDNSLKMASLRSQVYAADKTGVGVESALDNLSTYVYAHMNTSLTIPDGIYPPIQLANTYQRLVAQDNAKVTQAAKTYCLGLGHQPNGFYGGASHLTCSQSYVAAHPIDPSADIPQQLYQFDFISPTWSPDLAGWSLVASAGFLALLLTRLAANRISPRK